MTKALFNGRLYVQGLRRLRIIGLALAILCVSISVLIPVCTWIASAEYHVEEFPMPDGDVVLDPDVSWEPNGSAGASFVPPVEVVSSSALCVPVVVTSYLAPFLIFLMFNYLNHRKDSDFYHAIPFTRMCVYLSFGAAAMSWMLGILIAGGLASGLVWTMNPYVTYSFGGLLGQIALSCLNALLLASVACAVVSLTGTEGTACVAFILALSFWRILLACFASCIEAVNPLWVYADIWNGYCSPWFVLPLGLLRGMVDDGHPVTATQIVYAAVVAVGLFALGGVFYAKRKSELAGRAVPGKIMQTVLRTALTLLIAILGTFLLLAGELDFSTLLIFIAAVLLIYFLYELLTTKSVKGMLRAAPWLSVVLGACVLFCGAVHVSNYAVTHENLEAERIESVELYSQNLSWNRGSGNVHLPSDHVLYQMTKHRTDHPEVIALIAQMIRDSQEQAKEGEYNRSEIGTVIFEVKCNLKNGTSVVRRLIAPIAKFNKAAEIWKTAEGIAGIPRAEEVNCITVSMREMLDETSWRWRDVSTYDREKIKVLMDALQEDWIKMSDEEREVLLGNVVNTNTEEHFVLYVIVEKHRSFTYYPLMGSHTAERLSEFFEQENRGETKSNTEKKEAMGDQ